MVAELGQATVNDVRAPLHYAWTDALTRIVFLLRTSFIEWVKLQTGSYVWTHPGAVHPGAVVKKKEVE
jgi:hypothetical protein